MFSNRKTDTETNGKAGLTGRERRKGNSPPSLIGPDLTIHGELSTPGDLQIDGHIQSPLTARVSAGTLTRTVNLNVTSSD